MKNERPLLQIKKNIRNVGDKQRIKKKIVHNMTESESIYISVSDKTSKAALSTFRALREEVK